MKRRTAGLCIDCGQEFKCPGDRCDDCRYRKNILRRIRWAAFTLIELNHDELKILNATIKPRLVVSNTQSNSTD